MSPDRRRRRTLILAAVLVPLLIVVAFGLSLAGTAGRLPWQEEPTRIPITPFADLPPAQPTPTPPGSTSSDRITASRRDAPTAFATVGRDGMERADAAAAVGPARRA